MNPRFSNKRNNALTRVEVMVVIVVLMILAVVIFQAFHSSYSNMRGIRSEVQRTYCVRNLKQIGIAFRIWEGDHNDKYPMQVSVTNGGAMELVAGGNVTACFLALSNKLITPEPLFCPADIRRFQATNFATSFNRSNISYFVNLDAVESYPQMFLDGDDNLTVGGVRVRPGIFNLWTNATIGWTKERHHGGGNIGLADGSVQQLTTDGLQQALQQTGVATNRLVIP
jgi:hypothetical protein